MAMFFTFPILCVLCILLANLPIVELVPRVCDHYKHMYDSGEDYACAGKWLFADFNGDGRADGFCNNDGTTADFYHLTPISGVYADTDMHRNPKTEGWCVSTEGVVMTGDINGDGKNDLICRFNDGNKFQVVYYDNGRFRTPMSMRVTLECPLATSNLLIGDVSGDRAADFVCADQSSGTIRIHYNGGEHSRRTRHAIDHRLHNDFDYTGYYEMELTFCRGTDLLFRLGDVNGDKKQDLVCYHNTGKASNNGGVDIAYAKSHGHFDKVTSLDFTSNLCDSSLDDFFVTDVNGDGYADLLCHANEDEEDIMFFDHETGAFTTTSHNNDDLDDCKTEKIFLADLNGDGMSDVACRSQFDDDELDLYFSSCIF